MIQNYPLPNPHTSYISQPPDNKGLKSQLFIYFDRNFTKNRRNCVVLSREALVDFVEFINVNLSYQIFAGYCNNLQFSLKMIPWFIWHHPPVGADFSEKSWRNLAKRRIQKRASSPEAASVHRACGGREAGARSWEPALSAGLRSLS